MMNLERNDGSHDWINIANEAAKYLLLFLAVGAAILYVVGILSGAGF